MAAQGLSGLDAEKMKLVQDLEIEMMTDMYARLTAACHKNAFRQSTARQIFKKESQCALIDALQNT